MALDPALIKWYHPTTKTEGDSHGGDINTSDEITSGADQNIFDDVTNAQRIAGVTEYRKIFIRNENSDTWAAVKLWVSQFTDSPDDEISIALGTNAGTQSGEATGLTYVSPSSKVHADVLTVGDLAQNAYKAIWIKRVVNAAANGYTNNTFQLAVESS